MMDYLLEYESAINLICIIGILISMTTYDEERAKNAEPLDVVMACACAIFFVIIIVSTVYNGIVKGF